jgi:Tol biopolymer transport system component/putative hemolysin
MYKIFVIWISLTLLLGACKPAVSDGPSVPTQTQGSMPGIANPASQHCLDQGGTLSIEERSDGGQFGVCYFEDNYQCEEWAMFRGDCPVGGLKVTGYITPAARYCAITGGTYAISAEGGADTEQGTCTFKNGAVCDAWEYYNGACTPETGSMKWQTYTNAEVGFSIQTPQTWNQQTLPDQNEGNNQGMAFIGPEGGVEVYWGVGFGGACTTGTEPVQLAQSEVSACHATNSDGTEIWSQIGYEVEGGNSFSVRAYTSDAQPSSHDLVLQVLSALAFMPPEQPQAEAAIANPASQYCVDQGGTLEIEARGDGGQFGVCFFEDNRQCEEWAMLHGDCPVGGLKVTGYITPAARYCAITGGTYAITTEGSADTEQGTCTFKDGSQCDAWEHYNGACGPGQAAAPTSAAGMTIQPLPAEVCNGQAQAMSHTLDDLIPTQSEEPLTDTVNGVTGVGCQAIITGSGVDFESPASVVDELGVMLTGQGWTTDPMLVADGPTGTAQGYRKDDQICWASAGWEPDVSANCPKDQAISACPVTPEQKNYTVTLNCGVGTQAGPAPTEAEAGQILFDSTRGGNYRDLYIMNNDGYDLSRLTRGDANSSAGPWSPDGQRIVFTTYGLTNSAIAVINADGSGQTILSEIQGSDEGFPDWSPDGQRIAFTSRRDGNNEIYLMNADGLKQVQLTDHPGDDFAPSWSPDGTQIAFVSDRDQTAGIYDLYVMNADGSHVTRLTSDTAIDYSPDWSPDGKKIVFRSHHDGPADIYVINVDGSGLTNLTNHPAEDWAPNWSPDGSLIIFQTDRDGNWEIYQMGADGSDPVNMTLDPADDQLPYYRP